MSQFPPPQQFNPPIAQGGNGLVIAALVCGLLGFIIPLVGLVAIILAILAIVKPVAPGRGKGFQIVVLILAIMGTMFNCVGVAAGVMLPALGKARQSAREIKSGAQVQRIGVALQLYASANKDWLPESDDGLNRLIADGSLSPEMIVSPRAISNDAPHYIYLPPTKPIDAHSMPGITVVLYENPAVTRGTVKVLFLDGHVETLTDVGLNRYLVPQGASPAPPSAGGR